MNVGRASAIAVFILVCMAGGRSAGATDAFDLGCGPIRFVDTGTVDYRLKDVTPEARKGVGDLDRFHTRPAAEEMQKSQPYAGRIVDNLDFALRHSPNHHEALRLMIQWELSGGDLLGFPGARCGLDWARKFAHDDSTVHVYAGNYFWKLKDTQRAEAWYLKALELSPDSAEAHYNLGLFYYDQKEMEKSLAHARAAYAAGFPLPGLRDKLMRAGYSLTTGVRDTGSGRP